MIRLVALAAAVILTATQVLAAEDAPIAKGAAASSASTAAVSADKPAKFFQYIPKESDVDSGKEDAPVTIVEYASLSCPHCSDFFKNSLPELTSKYIDTGKIRLIYRNYPLNDPAFKAAELVECADPDVRHAYIKVLFTTQAKWAYDASYRDSLSNIAMMGGMDKLKFEACMNNKSVEKIVLNVAKEASDDYKVNSTPSFFINGTLYKGTHDAQNMSTAIDAALAKADKK